MTFFVWTRFDRESIVATGVRPGFAPGVPSGNEVRSTSGRFTRAPLRRSVTRRCGYARRSGRQRPLPGLLCGSSLRSDSVRTIVDTNAARPDIMNHGTVPFVGKPMLGPVGDSAAGSGRQEYGLLTIPFVMRVYDLRDTRHGTVQCGAVAGPMAGDEMIC